LYGEGFTGGEFHLGPVDWEETEWHNACAPEGGYAGSIRALEGDLLAGIWSGIPNYAGYCDACIRVKTARGKEATLRVVTYGETTPNSIDVSPAAFALLDSGEYPRTMTWHFAKCPDTGKIQYEFKTGAHEDWTSLWVRNARVPLVKVEVKSQRHGFVELGRESDGSLTDGGGFGVGPFTFRVTGVDGQVVTDTFKWPSGGITGKTLSSSGNFK
jgi:expansin (peptidoglycan-binding protein)